MHQKIIDALQWRYATKVFDPAKTVSQEDLDIILDSGRLAPSIAGVEPWKFLVIKNKALRHRLREANGDQPKLTDASHLIVIAARMDHHQLPDELVARTAKAQQRTQDSLAGLHQLAHGVVHDGTEQSREVILKNQTYLPLGIMVATASLLGIDNGPMLGHPGVDAVLGLDPKHLQSTAMLTLGYRSDDPAAARAKVRRDISEVVQVIA